MLAQEILTFAEIMDAGIHPDTEGMDTFFLASHIFQRRSVPLLPVFGSHDEDLIMITVIEGTAIRQDVVDFCITAIMKQSFDIELFLTVRTEAILLFIEPPFDDVLSFRIPQSEFLQFLLDGFIARPIIFYILFHLIAVLMGTRHFASEFDVYLNGTAIFPNDGIDDFDRLRKRSTHDRIWDFTDFFHSP